MTYVICEPSMQSQDVIGLKQGLLVKDSRAADDVTVLSKELSSDDKGLNVEEHLAGDGRDGDAGDVGRGVTQ